MLSSQSGEAVDDFIFENTSKSIENTNAIDKRHHKANSYNLTHSIDESGSQVDMRTLERIISEKVRSELESAVATVKTRVHQAISPAVDNSVIPRMEHALKSVGVFSAPNPKSVVLDSDHTGSSYDKIRLQMTASSRFNSNGNLNEMDETRGNITVEEAIFRPAKSISTGKHTLITIATSAKTW